MFDLLSVVECCVHIPIAVCVWDSLHRSGCRFSECQGSIDAVDDAEFILLSDLLSGIYFLLPFFPLCFLLVGTLLYALLDEPEKEASQCRWDTRCHDDWCHIHALHLLSKKTALSRRSLILI